ncbi:DUF2489 domain-containing protein [Thalassotalea agarivorans]|uniref:DUF2489 domain-containing protein n=1 Tax=Thalassotalea agarivorans TaxID=349064 RepID=A0A1I0CSJ0_THASX|nr:DUF2489 domain-containing protein [Thalassotalea agarivorans]SET22039.1 Protein of unknown function [Thalassotalea agarivorans]
MDNTMWMILAVVGALVILVLAFYAGRLLWLLKQQQQRQIEQTLALQKAHAEHDKKILDSVVIIVRAMQEKQCDISEGCWRLSVLLDSLKLSNELNAQFPAIFEMYGRIQHLSIMEARKQLPKKERMKQDFQRMQAEAELTDKVLEDTKSLRQFAQDQLNKLVASL